MRDFFFFIVLSLLIVQNNHAQYDNLKFYTVPEDVVEGYAFNLHIELLDGEQVNKAVLFYRVFGASEFLPLDLIIQGNSLIAEFGKNSVISPSIECYIYTVNASGTEKLYPTSALQTMNLLKIEVRKKNLLNEDIIILSPTANEILTSSDFFLAFSILRFSDRVKINSTKVFINEVDFSSLLQFSDDLIFIPQGLINELNEGVNTFKIILFDLNDKIISQSNYSFQIVTQEQKEELDKLKLSLNGSVELNLANENLRIGSLNYSRFNIRLNGNYGTINSTSNIYVTNEEKLNLQPQNRFSFQAFTDWFNLNIGDHFPIYPSLILSGKRVRGFSSSLMLGFFNIQTSFGEITRSIEGELLTLIKRDTVVLKPNLIQLDSSKYGQPFGLVKFGTYSRSLFTIRPSFVIGENFQVGFTYLHSKDDPKSIDFSARPKENLVLGTDIFFGADKKRIQLNFQSAFSLLNKDIAKGIITDATLDSLSKNDDLRIDPDLLRKLRDVLGNFITVNQHLSPLNPQQLPTLATEGSLTLNYFGNYFKGTYLYRGNEYSSFGQNYLRTDITGIQLTDRLSLFENRVFLSLSYEKLNDNLQKTKLSTTSFNNYEGAISLYLRRDFPVMNFTFSNYDTKNNIDPKTTDSLILSHLINDNIKVLNFSSSYDLNYYIRHKIFLSYFNSTKKDYTFKDFSSSFNSFNFSVQSIWNSDLISFFSTNISNSKIKAIDYDYVSITLGTRLNVLKSKLNNTASITVFSGDIKRNIFDLSSRYLLLKNLSALFSFRLILNDSKTKNESIFNFLLRYEI